MRLSTVALFSVLFSLACAEAPKKTTLNTVKDPPPTSAPVKVAEAPKPTSSIEVNAGPEAPNMPIYFAFDSDQLTDEAQSTLRQMAAYLKAHPTARLTIEGHCDESGSAEYNLALGDRRARQARGYLKTLGIEEARLNSISFGEEKPAVAGDDAKNRRGVFDLKVTG